MKTKLILTLIMACLLGSAAWAGSSAAIRTTEDAYINGLTPTTNFGTSVDLITGHPNKGGCKSYIRFDASGVDLLTRIDSFSVFWAGTLDRGRTINLFMIIKADGTDVDWTETGITWNNAPANAANIGTTNREFVAGTGEVLVNLGQFSTSGGQGFRTHLIAANSNITQAAKDALLSALNTGDRTVTIGMSWGSSNDENRPWRSREFGDGSSAAYLQVQTRPYITDLSPEKGAFVFAAYNPQLQWNQDASVAGTGVTYDVYIGTDPGAMTIKCDNVAGNGPFSCNPGALAFSEEYYWQVVAFEPNYVAPYEPNVYEGPVLSFMTDSGVVVVTGDPASQTVAAGTTTVQFSVSAINAASYQWYKDGNMLTGGANYSGQTTATLTINTVQLADEGFYHCAVSNAIPSTATSAAAQLITKRLVGRWTLQGNLNDSVASEVPGATGYNGAPLSGTAAFVTDSSFTALDLTGTDPGRVITMPGSAGFYSFHPRGYTVTAWVKASAATARGGIAGNFQGDGPGFGIVHNPTGNAVNRLGGAWGNGAVSTNIITNGEWRYVAITYDGLNGRTYVDRGRPEGEVQGTGATLSTATMMLGAEGILSGVPQNLFSGYLADVRIFSYALTNEEIVDYYHGLVGGWSCLYNDALKIDGINLDLNGDCLVNLADFALAASQWLDCNRYPVSECGL